MYEPRHAEVRHPHAPILPEQQVAGLDVAVHETRAVNRPQPGGRVRPDRDHLLPGRPHARGEDGGQIAAVHVLHHEVPPAVHHVAIEHPHHVLVLDAIPGPRLVPQPRHSRVRPMRRGMRDDFHDALVPEVQVLGQVADSMSAFAEPRDQPVLVAEDPVGCDLFEAPHPGVLFPTCGRGLQ